ncbi:uncharacterized protein [Asterias amurensis]|uniref:uncharacterized protein n=1 Tax=Asterias amurensis TaxID=7602 RepID=UPI003AB1FE0B
MIGDKVSMILTGFLVLQLSQLILSQEQSFITQPRNTFALLGESATFYCRIADKSGLVFWLKDSHIFARENQPQLGSSEGETPRAIFGNTTLGEYNLQLTGVAKKDQGRYECKVTSSVGTQSNLTSQPALLNVIDFPVEEFPVCVLSINDALTEGDVVELTCAYLNNSTTRPALSWERLDTPALLSNTKQVYRDGYFIRRHTITLTYKDDMSTYQCIASTPGRVTRSCTTGVLDVQHRPIVSITPTVLLAKTGDNARFSCRTSAANPSLVTYQWYYRGNAVNALSDGIDLIENAEGDPEILISNLVVPTGEVSVICEVTNTVGSSSAESLIRQEDAALVYITSEELLLWLIPCSVVVTLILLLLFIAIMTLDLCPCCRTCCNKKGGRRRVLSPNSLNSTWSAAENYGMSPSPNRSRRLSEPDSTDFYVTRAIRTPPPVDQTLNTSHHNSSGESRPHSKHTPSPNYRTPSSNYRTTSPNYYQSTPNGRLETDRIRPEETTGHQQYQQRRTRNRDHFRRGGSPPSAGMNRSNSHAEYSDIQIPTRNSGLSDSGLDFAASSSMDSRSPTPRGERMVYAQIVHNRGDESREATSRQGPPSPGAPSAGDPLPTSSTSNHRSTLEVPEHGMHRARSVELPPM